MRNIFKVHYHRHPKYNAVNNLILCLSVIQSTHLLVCFTFICLTINSGASIQEMHIVTFLSLYCDTYCDILHLVLLTKTRSNYIISMFLPIYNGF